MSGRPSDRKLAEDYLIVATAHNAGQPVHPKQKENAIDWIRLCSLRETRDPTTWLSTPWRTEIMRAAWDVADPKEDTDDR